MEQESLSTNPRAVSHPLLESHTRLKHNEYQANSPYLFSLSVSVSRMCRGELWQVGGVCTRCRCKSVKLWVQPQCFSTEMGIHVPNNDACWYGYTKFVSPFVEIRCFANNASLENGCVQCLQPHGWLNYLRRFVDSRDDELAEYLRDAPNLASDAFWQQQPYDLEMLHDVLPFDDQDSEDGDYDPNDLAIHEGPLKLSDHRELLERMEQERSGRSMETLQNTWRAHPYNDLVEDAIHDEDQPAYPYMDPGFDTGDPIVGTQRRYIPRRDDPELLLAGVQFEDQAQEQMPEHLDEEPMREYHYYQAARDPTPEHDYSVPIQEFLDLLDQFAQ